MALQLTRTLSAVAAGVASAGAEPGGFLGDAIKPIDLGGQKYNTVELAGAAGGFLLQLLMPFTMPNVVDGLVEGSLALLARRVTANMTATAPAPSAYSLPSHVAQRIAPRVAPQMTNIRGVPKYSLS